ncbi:MAG: N-acetyltransferase [Calditrichaeota bacterium]|nr:MAG: N-acetyltransferase [Calditrichota bacterium]MBL1207042.1 N-acetyltransferase [Calditrichota bacterium]NOG46870.1 N-acetyltransferase [Calditrichota bacterium]
MNIVIRPEEEADFFKVEELTREAFWNLYKPGCDEHYTAHKLRNSSDFLKHLDFVAEINGNIVGNIMYTKSYVENEKAERIETATFGPLCVHPNYQRLGIGRRLIEETKKIAINDGYPAIIILGDPHNYYKHGFKTGKDFNISTMDGKYPSGLLVLELQKGVFNNHNWKFKESDSFEVDMEEVDLFDKKFPIKKKEHKSSQDLFSIMIRSYIE